ncbi:MAG: hypothetical protein ACJ0US_06735 [Arenicellales bacterium]|jgi:hypothetical protein|tara:strand:- start:97 stop:222 length:126 start_codon:yes stop_codon:yes gene_type:complete
MFSTATGLLRDLSISMRATEAPDMGLGPDMDVIGESVVIYT